jgi:hypothetical protein
MIQLIAIINNIFLYFFTYLYILIYLENIKKIFIYTYFYMEIIFRISIYV